MRSQTKKPQTNGWTVWMKCSKRCRRSSRYLWQHDQEYRKREGERQKVAYAKKFFGYDAALTKKFRLLKPQVTAPFRTLAFLA
jgi:hypothetical protein